jgi:hypothetical protein
MSKSGEVIFVYNEAKKTALQRVVTVQFFNEVVGKRRQA